MGNDVSSPYLEDDIFPSPRPDGKGGMELGAPHIQIAVPPMSLIIENLVWRQSLLPISTDKPMPVGPEDSSMDQNPEIVRAVGQRIWCTVLVDGRELGPPIQFPGLGNKDAPLKVEQRGPTSHLAFCFSKEDDRMDYSNRARGPDQEDFTLFDEKKWMPSFAPSRARIQFPIAHLVRFGAPLYTTLCLGLPYDGEHPLQLDLAQAVQRGMLADSPKVTVTLFRPGRQDDRGEFQPDIQACLVEDAEGLPFCARDVRTMGPTSAMQVKGLMRSLQLMSSVASSLQDKHFEREPSHNPAMLPGEGFTTSQRSLSVLSAPGEPSDYQLRKLQDELQASRTETMKLQAQLLESQRGFPSQAPEESSPRSSVQVRALQEELQSLRNETSKLHTQLRDRIAMQQPLEYQVTGLQKEVEAARNMACKLQEELSDRIPMKQVHEQLRSLQQELAASRDEASTLQAELNEHTYKQQKFQVQDHVRSLQEELQASRDAASKLQADLDEHTSNKQRVDYQVRGLQEDLEASRNEATTLRAQLGEHAATQETLKASRDEASKLRAQLNERSLTQQPLQQQVDEQVRSLQEDLQASRNVANKLQAELLQSLSQQQPLDYQVRSLQEEVQKSRSEMTRLQGELSDTLSKGRAEQERLEKELARASARAEDGQGERQQALEEAQKQIESMTSELTTEKERSTKLMLGFDHWHQDLASKYTTLEDKHANACAEHAMRIVEIEVAQEKVNMKDAELKQLEMEFKRLQETHAETQAQLQFKLDQEAEFREWQAQQLQVLRQSNLREAQMQEELLMKAQQLEDMYCKQMIHNSNIEASSRETSQLQQELQKASNIIQKLQEEGQATKDQLAAKSKELDDMRDSQKDQSGLSPPKSPLTELRSPSSAEQVPRLEQQLTMMTELLKKVQHEADESKYLLQASRLDLEHTQAQLADVLAEKDKMKAGGSAIHELKNENLMLREAIRSMQASETSEAGSNFGNDERQPENTGRWMGLDRELSGELEQGWDDIRRSQQK